MNGATSRSRCLTKVSALLAFHLSCRLFGQVAVPLESMPLTPEESLKQIHVPEGFAVQLVASEPQVLDPVALDWDANGRLWVVEMADYPYGLDGQGKPGGRVRYLEDMDHDGYYERSTLFLEAVNFPTSVMAWKKGVLVAAAPEIFYAEDRDGDGRADFRQVLFRGFIEGNQQLRVNSLRWGLDNWVYAASGGHHAGFGSRTMIHSPISGMEVELGSRDFRMRPEAGRLDPLSGPAQFGRVRDDWGNGFGVQNSFPLWHYVLEDGYLRRNSDVASSDPRNQLRLPPNPKVYPNKSPQKRFHSFEQSGRFTSACGPSIYRDQILFPEVPGITHAFTCEPFHNVVQHHLLVTEGVSFQGRRAESETELDFFASADRWCRPVMSRTGPDGALYIVDMYRYMIEHPDWLPEEGRSELKPHYREGQDRGRIYRILPKEALSRGAVPFRKGSSLDALCQGLQSANGPIRDLAHRGLVHSSDTNTVDAVLRIFESSSDARVRLQALGVLDGRQGLTQVVLHRGLNDPHPAIRRHALKLAESSAREDVELLKQCLGLVDDEDLSVRLQLACSLGEWSSEAAGSALIQIATTNGEDRFFRQAIISSMTPHFDRVGQALLSLPAFTRSMIAMAVAREDRLDRLLQWVFPEETVPLSVDRIHLCRELIDSLETLRRRSASPTHPSKAVATAMDRLFQVTEEARRIVVEDSASMEMRCAAVFLLGRQPALRQDDLQRLTRLLMPNIHGSLRRASLQALVEWNHPDATTALLTRWPSLGPESRNHLLNQMLRYPDNAMRLLKALESGTVAISEIGASHRQQLMHYSDKRIAPLAERLFHSAQNIPRNELHDDMRLVPEMAGLAVKGRQWFVDRCSMCHELDQVGRAIGPDLRSLTNRSAEALLVAILNPNLNVEPRYQGYSITLDTDENVYGLIASETGNSIVMELLDGSERQILTRHIRMISGESRSFMPENLTDGMSQQDLADLIAYLQEATSP